MAFTQDNKLMSLTTPLGKDVLLLSAFRGTEAISSLFSFELDLLSSNNAIAFENIIGEKVTVTVELADKSVRYFNGVISRFSQSAGRKTEGSLRLSQYRATMVPWTWLLTRTSDSRIFQNLSVPEILEKIFQEKKLTEFSMEVQEKHEKREYCVQYRETDFNFISRLMEEEGICYYFTHSENTHTMVIADTPAKHKKLSRPVRHYRVEAGINALEDTISIMEKVQEIQAGKYTLNDFNFEISNTSLKASLDSGQRLGPGERERYDYPGGYAAKDLGDRLARIRIEEEEARVTTISGEGNCREFCSGYRFTLKNALRQDMNEKEYLLTSVVHEGSQPWEGESPVVYGNTFTCIPFSVPFRPPLKTHKPFIHGSQTAMVTGPAGEEIHTDKYGRVKVQFHWDREGKRDENTTCWIRVGQIWAGQGWGAVFIPRIGHEVIVSFLEGDPDRPLITGNVYDNANMPPYALPDEKTKSTIRSRTTPNAQTYNELLLEDKTGKTQVVLSNAYGHKITQDEETQTLTVQTRDKNMITMDDKNKNIMVVTTNAHKLLFDDQNKKILLTSTDGHKIEIDDQNKKMTTSTKDGHTMIFDDQNKKVSLTSKDGHTLVLDDQGKKMGVTSKSGHALVIDDGGKTMSMEDSTGQHRFMIDIGGKKLTIATDSGGISLMASAGKIIMDGGDVEIKAANSLKLSGGVSGELNGGATTTVKGMKVSVEGSAITEIKGTLVKIN
jgi:type VI secretion system secreted protein VgrG